ncbi:MAG: biotin/lipoyl-binding protein, partial [Comamonadaceae bacterium]
MAEINQKAFEQIGKVVQAGGAASDSVFGRALRRLAPAGAGDSLDWAGDADWARLQQEPLRARILLRLAVLFLLLLLVWAAYAELDEVTRGDGKVVPTSQVQVIQSVDGGVVETLAVREGQIVEPGQLLLRVDSTRFLSTMLESRASLLSLQAKALRLQALTQGGTFIPPPELLRDAPDIVAQEMRLYRSRREEI